MLTDFEMQVEENNEIVILRITGELDALAAPKVKGKLIDLMDKGKKNFLIDLKEVEHINSLAMGILRGRLREIKENNGDIKLLNLSEHLTTIFEMVGLDEVFEIFSSEQEALNSFN